MNADARKRNRTTNCLLISAQESSNLLNKMNTGRLNGISTQPISQFFASIWIDIAKIATGNTEGSPTRAARTILRYN